MCLEIKYILSSMVYEHLLKNEPGVSEKERIMRLAFAMYPQSIGFLAILFHRHGIEYSKDLTRKIHRDLKMPMSENII